MKKTSKKNKSNECWGEIISSPSEQTLYKTIQFEKEKKESIDVTLCHFSHPCINSIFTNKHLKQLMLYSCDIDFNIYGELLENLIASNNYLEYLHYEFRPNDITEIEQQLKIFKNAFSKNKGVLNKLVFKLDYDSFISEFKLTKNENQKLLIEISIICETAHQKHKIKDINNKLHSIIKIINTNAIIDKDSITSFHIDSDHYKFSNGYIYNELIKLYEFHKNSLKTLICYEFIQNNEQSFIEFFIKHVKNISNYLKTFGSRCINHEQLNAIIDLIQLSNIQKLLLYNTAHSSAELINKLAETQSTYITEGCKFVTIEETSSCFALKPFLKRYPDIKNNNDSIKTIKQNNRYRHTKSARNRLTF